MSREMIIKPRPPYRILLHLKTFTIPGKPIPGIFENNTCRRLFGENAWSIKIIEDEDVALLRVRIYFGDSDRAMDIIKRIYNVDLDYEIVLNKARKYPTLFRILNIYRGLRPALNATMWESLIKTIVMQNIPLKMALKITSNLVQNFGNKVTINSTDFYDFPPPERLYASSIGELKNCGLSKNKAEYIRNAARDTASGLIDLESIAKRRPKEAIEELLSIRGVGPWTAKLAYMAYTGYMGLELFEDRSVQRAISMLNLDKKIILEEFDESIGLILYILSIHNERNRGAHKRKQQKTERQY